MRENLSPQWWTIAALVVCSMVAACAASAAEPVTTEQIQPAEISLGEAARLTITASGSNLSPIAPPAVPGLEFVVLSQTQQIESINGVTTASTTVTYQVIPQEAGIFTIPSLARGSQPLVLRVSPSGTAPGGTASGSNPRTPNSPPPAGGQNGADAGLTTNGTAFVRLRVAKHELYVGESLPVEIQVGVRDGLVASLNGLPTMNGDAFTLNKLSNQPQRTEELIDGKPFTILTWRSVLAAVKPGALSMTIETPVTVRMRTRARPLGGLLGDPALDEVFNDPIFQNFFAGTTEKEITVASAPAAFTVLPLPTEGRPADFSGAVGTFQVSSELSDSKVAAGDPLTLRLHVTGAGNFDRINGVMLSDLDHWKTYQPTAAFKPADDIGFEGEKIFEQPLIAAQPGAQALPGLAFSYFDPKTRRYEVARTGPLSVTVSPAPAGGSLTSSVAGTLRPPPSTDAAPTAPEHGGLRPDQAEAGAVLSSLRPLYSQPRFLAIPAGLILAFSGAWAWSLRRERRAKDSIGASRRAASQTTEALLGQMETASACGNAALFFTSARSALQRSLAARWHLAPQDITIADIEARLGGESDVRRVFALADEANYSGRNIDSTDLQRWNQIVLRHVQGEHA
jgi:hypothetical protein